MIIFSASYCQSSWKIRTRKSLLFQSLSSVHIKHTFVVLPCTLLSLVSTADIPQCRYILFFWFSFSIKPQDDHCLIQVFNPFLLLLYYFPPSLPSLTLWSEFSLQVTYHTYSLVNRFICFISPYSLVIIPTLTSINPTTYLHHTYNPIADCRKRVTNFTLS